VNKHSKQALVKQGLNPLENTEFGDIRLQQQQQQHACRLGNAGRGCQPKTAIREGLNSFPGKGLKGLQRPSGRDMAQTGSKPRRQGHPGALFGWGVRNSEIRPRGFLGEIRAQEVQIRVPGAPGIPNWGSGRPGELKLGFREFNKLYVECQQTRCKINNMIMHCRQTRRKFNHPISKCQQARRVINNMRLYAKQNHCNL